MKVQDAIKALKRPQLIQLLKKIKSFLSINATGKNKEELADAILELHGKGKANMFYGKKLLGFEGEDVHIVVPSRETKQETKTSKAEKELKRIKKKQGEVEISLAKQRQATKELAKIREDFKTAKTDKEIMALQKRIDKLSQLS